MSNLVRIYICEELRQSINNLRLKLAIAIKKKYNLKEVTISDGFTSQVLSARMDNEKFINFKIDKVSDTKGIIRIL